MSGARRGQGWREPCLSRYAVVSDRAESSKPLIFAVAEGNHFLSTVKAYRKKNSGAESNEDHPARFVLVQLQNLHHPTLEFEPILFSYLSVPGRRC